MEYHFMESPNKTELGDTTYLPPNISREASFVSPAKGGRNDLLSQMRGHRHPLATPRNALAALRQPLGRQEFTPLLNSGTKKRLLAGDRNEEYRAGMKLNGALSTPALLRPGYKFDSPALPEASMMDEQTNSSSVAQDVTLPPAISSSAISTPMALPKKGQEGMLDNGNVLTLREQEAKLEQIDKENFGLKLKIHFLEENLRKSGTEFQQATIRENTDLKVDKAKMQLELKKYGKDLKRAEHELEEYRRQLQEYAERVKRRHADEGMKEELDELRRLVDERSVEIRDLQERLDQADGDDEELQKLRDTISDLEAEIREKEGIIDEREEQIENMNEKLQSAEGDQDADIEEKERQISDLEEKVEELQAKLRQMEIESEEAADGIQQKVDEAAREKDEELRTLQRKLDSADQEHKDAVALLEERLAALGRDKDLEIRALQRQVQAAERDKQDEIDALMDRLKLAESQGDNQLQLAQQAANDVREQLRQVTREKDVQLETLQARVDVNESAKDELDECRAQLREHTEKDRRRQAEDRLNEERMLDLQKTLAEREKELSSLNEHNRELERTSAGRESVLGEVKELQSILFERARQLGEVQVAREAALEEVKQLQSALKDRSRELETARTTLQERTSELEALRAHADEPETQLEVAHSIVRERDHDLEQLRQAVDEKESALDELQRTADERLEAVQELQAQLERTREDLLDEQQVLQEDIEQLELEKADLQSRLAILEGESNDTQNLQSKFVSIERELRAAEREKSSLQSQISALESDLNISDQDRDFLQSRVDKLSAELQAAKQSANSDYALVAAQEEAEDLKALVSSREKDITGLQSKLQATIREKEKQLREMLLEKESLQLQVSEREGTIEAYEAELAQREAALAAPQIQELQSKLRNTTKELANSKARLRAAQQEQNSAVEEGLALREEILGMEKRHQGELRGLAKQIGYLRRRAEREGAFREGLGFQKKWFLMNVAMYGECTKASLNLVAEMGITPDETYHQRRPSLRAVVLTVISVIRMRNMKEDWGKSKRVHEGLMRKLESMRRSGARRSVVEPTR